jgi:hypothetical protein
VPSANWSNDDFDEDSGKFRRRNGGGAAAADDDEGDSSDEDEETPVRSRDRKPASSLNFVCGRLRVCFVNMGPPKKVV